MLPWCEGRCVTSLARACSALDHSAGVRRLIGPHQYAGSLPWRKTAMCLSRNIWQQLKRANYKHATPSETRQVFCLPPPPLFPAQPPPPHLPSVERFQTVSVGGPCELKGTRFAVNEERVMGRSLLNPKAPQVQGRF